MVKYLLTEEQEVITLYHFLTNINCVVIASCTFHRSSIFTRGDNQNQREAYSTKGRVSLGYNE